MRFTILTLLFLSLGSLFGQVDSLTTFQVGIGGGQYFSSVNFTFLPSRPFNGKLLPGPQFGAGIRYFNRRSAGFIAELNYSGGGWREEIIEQIGNDTIIDIYERELAYIELQMLTQIAIGRKRFRPFLEAGPYLAFPVKDTEKLPTVLTVPSAEYYFEQDIGGRFNFGIVAGVGIYIDLKKVGIQLGARYLAGVRDIIEPGSLSVSTSRRQSIGWRANVWFDL